MFAFRPTEICILIVFHRVFLFPSFSIFCFSVSVSHSGINWDSAKKRESWNDIFVKISCEGHNIIHTRERCADLSVLLMMRNCWCWCSEIYSHSIQKKRMKWKRGYQNMNLPVCFYLVNWPNYIRFAHGENMSPL